MFKFFTDRKWLLWSWGGTALIIFSLWYAVEVDVMINEWFGEFYNMIQKALSEPGAITADEYWHGLLSFGKLAAIWIAVKLAASFFTSHWLFRWRQSMVDYYHAVYNKASHIEGASQRVQEDTIKFTRLMESIFTEVIEAILVLIAFVPILWGLSTGLNISFFGDWQYGLAASSIIWAVGGTIFMLLLGKVLGLVGVEYDIQKREAAYRKMLVIAEDDNNWVPKNLGDLFNDVRAIHYRSFARYLGFNIGRLAYLQANVLVGYVLLAPAIVAGAITLGVMQQILRAFGRVSESLQVILRAWPSVIELMSVYKRLKEFEEKL